MAQPIDAPTLFFAPFVSSSMAVEAAWIDYNGHMNVAYYTLLFDRAIDECFALCGLGEDYVARRGGSFFAAEAHLSYLRELRAGDMVRMTLQLIDFDEKRIHFFMEMRHAHEGWLAATSENLSLHVGIAARRVTAFPDDILASLALMKASHSRLPAPERVGRAVAMRRPPAEGAGQRRH